MPLVMIDISIAIQIGRLECFRLGLREMVLKFRPTDQFISVGIHVGKMYVEALWDQAISLYLNAKTEGSIIL